ncbi:PREDICTED: D-3-phosphoglycerate dehydrogenase isoform X1 [Ceratosolen solmsi marchali]|uniref:D-3-phosphoglycerate dehydrogenase n=1 Tax=Ceratosolen solmsi marchali TaxID=326594 RepID=A0AAJ6VJV2_9HYME|nr:PREDICTED: D-3-phosphoglycerate dehydrogenase isoform X1 [Ceratosolen solmsi marchali]
MMNLLKNLSSPGGNSISACELTCVMISALARHVMKASQSLKDGNWDRKLFAGSELFGKVLGIIGFGRIGREVARRMQSYGMKVIVFDPFLTSEQAAEFNVTLHNLDVIWVTADFITVHTPLNVQTKNLINSETLKMCKKGIYIINVARGGIVDEKALLESIKAGHCAGAALDVFTEEPPKNPIILELIKHPNVIATPHLGASTVEAQIRVGTEIAEQFLSISGLAAEYPITGIVNAPAIKAAIKPENKPWIELGIRLGKILSKLVNAKSHITIENSIHGLDDINESFFNIAIQAGFLLNIYENVNLVNASVLAKECNIQINTLLKYSSCNIISLKAGDHLITGTIRGDRAVLLSINDSIFSSEVCLPEHTSLYLTHELENLSEILNTHRLHKVTVNSINLSNKWVLVHTNKPQTLPVNGIKYY